MSRRLWLAAALALGGCGNMDFQRIDGKPLDEHAFQTSATICKGELAKAEMSDTQGPNMLGGAVIRGCMAQQGYEVKPAQ